VVSEAAKEFMPYTTPDGRRRYVNMAQVLDFGLTTNDKGEVIGTGTELMLPVPMEPGFTGCSVLYVVAEEPPEYFLGRRIEKGGHR
jgi:hypothetical protein